MEIRQYWLLLRKWLWLLLLGVLLAGGTSFLVSRRMTPVYQTGATVLVAPGSTAALDNYSALIASERLAQTYSQLIGSAPILAEVYERLGLTTPGEVEASQDAGRSGGFSVSATPVRDTQLIRVQVSGTDPELIAAAANTVVEVFVEWLSDVQRARYVDTKANLEAEMERVQTSIHNTEAEIASLEAQDESANASQLSRLQDQIAQYRNSYSALVNSYSAIGMAEANSGDTVTVVSEAAVPGAPVSPRVMQNTLLAAAVGGMLAAGIAFLIEYLDDTVKEPADVEATGLAVMAAVQRTHPNGRGAKGNVPAQRLVTVAEPRSHLAEAYRTLRTNLQFSSLDHPLRKLMVASAIMSEGKTTTAGNLAVVMAQGGKRVVLVDTDLRRPAVHKLFGLPNSGGLTNLLMENPEVLNGYLRATEVENLRVLTSGPLPPNPQELLASQRMQDVLHKLEEEADLVVIDTPAALPVADASVLAAHADGVLMVVDAGGTRRAALVQATDSLRQVGANLVGIVMNKLDTRGGRGYYSYYYYYYSSYYREGGQHQRGLRGWWRRLRRRGKKHTRHAEAA